MGPLGVGSLLADPPLIHRVIGGQVYAVAHCAQHRASPDLLAALTALLAARDAAPANDGYTHSHPAWDTTRAAIAKATGESVSPLGLFATNRPQEDAGS